MSISNLLQTNDFVQRNQAKALAAKWEKTGLLEGLRSETERAGMSQLLENQARQLVKEASATGIAAGSEEWSGVALPLVRRIFAEFAAKEFVSVQPMNLPSGLIFYLWCRSFWIFNQRNNCVCWICNNCVCSNCWFWIC